MHNFFFKSDEKICRVYRDSQIDHISKTKNRKINFSFVSKHKDHIIKTAFFEGGGFFSILFIHKFYFFSSQNGLERMLKKIVSALFEERGGGSADHYLGQGPNGNIPTTRKMTVGFFIN